MRNRHELFLDDLPTDWDKARIDELGEVVGGSTPSRDNPRFWGGDISWVTPGELTGLSTKYLGETREEITEAGLASCGARLLQAESLLVTSRATLGAVALAKAPLATNQGFKSITFDSRCAPSFFYHLFKTLNPELSRRASGTTFLEIPAREFRAISLPVPPLLEQRQIAEILDTVDEAIRKTEQIIAKLQQVKQGLLHDLLTRGIDDNGELRDPVRHPEQFKDSPLGRIPRAWQVGDVLGVGSQTRQPILTGPFGAQLGAGDFVDSGVPVLRIGNVQWGYLDLENLLHVTSTKADSLARFRIHVGDLLFARQGATTGRNALADERADGFLINYHIIRVALDHEKCHPVFLYSVFNSPVVQQQVDREKGRSTREGVSTKTLTSFILPIPPKNEQDRIAGIISEYDERVHVEKSRAEKLRLLKSGLMEDLLTGRVRVTKLLEQAAE